MRARVTQKLAFGITWAAGIITVLVLVYIIGYVIATGWRAITPDFLFRPPSEGGISTAIVGTIYIVVLTIAIATPLGIGAAIYLTEYATENWITRLVRYGIETLAGVPSIVFGLFGFALFALSLLGTRCLLAGALTLACLVLPTMIRASEEAIKAVPVSIREASLALGATRWQTIRHAVMPAALPGVMTAIILSIGRTVEETACLYVAMGINPLNMPISPLSGGTTLSLHLYYLAMEVPFTIEPMFMEKAMGTGVVLILIIIIINSLTHWISSRYAARMIR